jgi:hypothetical protein
VNGREHTLEAPVRWKDGVLVMPGQSRSILAMNLATVPIPDVAAADGDLFDGSEVDLTSWRAAEPRPAVATRGKRGDGSLPTAWRVAGRREWQFIVIHHSATDNGGAESFGREHQKKWPNGLGYHFVIGNGIDTADGQVEVDRAGPARRRGSTGPTPATSATTSSGSGSASSATSTRTSPRPPSSPRCAAS